MTIHAKMLALCAQYCQEIYRGFEGLVTECMDTQQISQLSPRATDICQSYVNRYNPSIECPGRPSWCIPAYVVDEMGDDLNHIDMVFTCTIVLLAAAFLGYQYYHDLKNSLVVNAGGFIGNNGANQGNGNDGDNIFRSSRRP